jgi:hypothetical protein
VNRLGLVLITIAFCFFTGSVNAQRERTELEFPDIPGYVTLKCEFHMHTVFSDGSVWPPVRVDEAWREGYDAISITDHLEYLPHRHDMVLTNFNRSYELAKGTARSLDLLLVRAAELTRGEPPGHWNLLFLKDANAIPTKDYREALRAARKQEAFVFWNHPGWKQPNRKSKWYDEQQEAFTNGWLHGIEIVNGSEYDPIAHQWCLDKKLTMVGNSDLHGPSAQEYGPATGKRRPVTLVFAKEKSLGSLKEALFSRRTAVCANNFIYGEKKYLHPLFDQWIEVKTPSLTIRPKGRALLQVHNDGELDLVLASNGQVDGVGFPETITLSAGKTVALDLRRTEAALEPGTRLELPYSVQNMKIAPDHALSVRIGFVLARPGKN